MYFLGTERLVSNADYCIWSATQNLQLLVHILKLFWTDGLLKEECATCKVQVHQTNVYSATLKRTASNISRSAVPLKGFFPSIEFNVARFLNF